MKKNMILSAILLFCFLIFIPIKSFRVEKVYKSSFSEGYCYEDTIVGLKSLLGLTIVSSKIGLRGFSCD